LEIRKVKDQCAEVIHHRLLQEGMIISLSSVKRTLKREGVTRFSKWKKWHQYPPRPEPEKPGILVEIDSMQEGLASEHLRAYALIDVASRWAYAEATDQVNAVRSVRFVQRAAAVAPFNLCLVQTDNGSEFSKHFTAFVGINHRHTRVRTPTDNAHVERFIQTLQRQCLDRIPKDLRVWKRELPEFLRWYNWERPHMALAMQTPIEVLKRFQGID
jgi:transposase InsO family protein